MKRKLASQFKWTYSVSALENATFGQRSIQNKLLLSVQASGIERSAKRKNKMKEDNNKAITINIYLRSPCWCRTLQNHSHLWKFLVAQSHLHQFLLGVIRQFHFLARRNFVFLKYQTKQNRHIIENPTSQIICISLY